ncbi:MAG TPA: hypothetical protein VFH97_04955, partial [Gemmatimonadales bacterium]|nr:hypothetical protein [Gemmatimonadales bacterium]
MSSETARLRALLFGEGEFARAEPLEPSLLPPLLRLVPIQPMVLAAVDLVVQLYPDLRREALSAVASGLGAMPAEERDALLRVHPALLLYAARDVLEKARELAQDQPDPALRVLLLVKLAVLGVGNRGAALDALRALARATGRDEAARLDGWLQVAERGGPAEREEAVAALRGSPELIYHPDLVAALAQLLPPTERVQVSRAALDALVQTDVQAPELGSWALTRLAPGLTAGEQADVFARALSLAGSLPARWQRLEAARHVLSALRRPDVGPDTRTAVGRLLPGLIRGEEARTPILAYLQAHLRESDAPLPPIHPLAAQAAQLARAAGKADPGEAARVALDALVGSLDRWFPREPQPTTRRPTPSGAFMFDMMDQLGVEAPPAPAPRPAAPAPPPPSIEAAAIPEA